MKAKGLFLSFLSKGLRQTHTHLPNTEWKQFIKRIIYFIKTYPLVPTLKKKKKMDGVKQHANF